MKTREYTERYAVLTVGLFFMALGIALSIRAGLGITPISCPPYVLSLGFPQFTVGQFTMAMHIIFVALQVLILRSKFPKIQYIQLVMGIVFGFFIDFANLITMPLIPTHYWHRIVLVLAGSASIGFGVVLEVQAKAMLIAGEGLMLALSNLWKIPFGKVKMGFDFTLLISSLVFAYFLGWNEIMGQGAVREGTVISALLVGMIAGKIQSLIGPRLSAWLDRHNEKEMDTDTEISVITIAREFGSGGHEIGEKLAKQLGWTFIDQQLINNTVNTSGLSTEFIAQYEQNMTEGKRIWKDIWMDNIQPVDESLSPEDQLFVAQGKLIKEEAQKGHCVIVGRCANWVLKDNPHCFHLFITASMPFARRRVMEEFKYDGEKAYDEIMRINQARATHYNYYTNSHWGAPNNYDLCIKSSSLGIDGSINAIIQAIKKH